MIDRRQLLALFSAALLAIVLTIASSDADARDSGAFVKDLGDRAIEMLTSKETSKDEQERRFRTLLREGFAIDKIGKFVLGKYRRKASKGEIEDFLLLFEDYIVSLYSSAFRNFSGETFNIKRVVKTKRARDTMVITQIVPTNNGAPTKMIFQVRTIDKNFKILDIRIEGVSMIITQRDEFTTYISKHGGTVAALIDALRKKTKDLKTRAKDDKK
ncbi:MAG: ABC transporter substrate-binding protein [Alphaproteobacteria bacterium]|jgi:phospholipid transport system substrate-binding protein|nr:ABC transporter substrate-binding protein [Alphaproteobacteria bacterium]|tara:strand:- start:113 stop:757 length:645 start_codon:yes stop_codon:yes gene_type:complete